MPRKLFKSEPVPPLPDQFDAWLDSLPNRFDYADLPARAAQEFYQRGYEHGLRDATKTEAGT